MAREFAAAYKADPGSPMPLAARMKAYLVKIYAEKDDLPDASRYSEQTEVLILIFGIGFISIVFLAIRFLFRKVALVLDVTENHTFLPRTPCRIALGNLIRNAFQYTVQGSVVIRVAPRDTGYGFGLGLSLVEQICARLGLTYETRKTNDGYRASISWTGKFDPGSNGVKVNSDA